MAISYEDDSELAEICGARLVICVLGRFRVIGREGEIPISWGSKTAALLSDLALRERFQAPSETLLAALWPRENDEARARNALTSLVGDLRKRFKEVAEGASPIVTTPNGYRLNTQDGITVDADRFAALVDQGERQQKEGRIASAVDSWWKSAALYSGDLHVGDDVRFVIERERLRSLHHLSLWRLAEYFYGERDHSTALEFAFRLLEQEPCSEQAHRLVMKCQVSLGRRPLALRQYKVCERILATEYQAKPEAATQALYDQLRRQEPY
ncbi:BTAD domain-containing putative transcriptional regulator [Kitasatospora sp. NPDC085464]|uniref:AfsR/SARP family transcriptional regulator n=1 Tax=Kitasatospora sp. NPDC085464 TaxID=3364063 RepID=UPI0037CBBDBE